MAGYSSVTPLEDPTNSFVEIASALIHDCLVGIERGGTTISNRGTLISLSIQGGDLPEQRFGGCLSRLVALRDQMLDGRDQLRHALRRVSQEWNYEVAGWILRRGRGMEGIDFHLRFGEFVWEIQQSLHDAAALRAYRDRIQAFLGVRLREPGVRCERTRVAAVLYDTLQGLDALVHGRLNHGNILPRLVSLDEDPRHYEELVMARDVICGILPGPSILTFETAVMAFFVPLLATGPVVRFFRQRPELGRLCEQVAFGERQALDAARRALRHIMQEPFSTPRIRRRHDHAPYRTRHHIHHLHWCDPATCRREAGRPNPHPLPPPPFFYPLPVTRFYTDHPPPMPSPVIPPDSPPLQSSPPRSSQTGRFTYWA